MIRAEIIAVGKMRKGPMLDLWDEYVKRMQWPLTLHEIDDKDPQKWEQKLAAKLNNRAFVVMLDERGKILDSREFAGKIETLSAEGLTDVQFIIGGADGFSSQMRQQADFILSFGRQTWPHMLARIMLIEQIYRAQQILAGHPYHRD